MMCEPIKKEAIKKEAIKKELGSLCKLSQGID
jgi:hypothetical protein